MNSALQSVSKRRNVFISPKCKELIKDFRQVKWRRDSNGNSLPDLDKSTRDRTHVSDAFGYLAAKEFGMYPPAGERSGVIV